MVTNRGNESFCYLNLYLPHVGNRYVALQCISSDHTFRNVRTVTSIISAHTHIYIHTHAYARALSIYLSPSYSISHVCGSFVLPFFRAMQFTSLSLLSPFFFFLCISKPLFSFSYVSVSHISVCRGNLMSRLLSHYTKLYSHESFLWYNWHMLYSSHRYTHSQRFFYKIQHHVIRFRISFGILLPLISR